MAYLENYFYGNQKELIEYKGEKYFDDRIFHLHLTLSKKHNYSDGLEGIEIGDNFNSDTYTLYTRRNSVGRKPVKVDNFSSYQEAMSYIEKVEPEVPLISLNGKPLSPKPSIQDFRKLVTKNNWLPTFIDI